MNGCIFAGTQPDSSVRVNLHCLIVSKELCTCNPLMRRDLSITGIDPDPNHPTETLLRRFTLRGKGKAHSCPQVANISTLQMTFKSNTYL